MDDNSYNFYEVVEAAEQYFSEHGRGKGSGFKPYERWKSENESKFAPSGDRMNIDYYKMTKAYRELAKDAQNNKMKSSFDNGWVELGPWDANNITSHYSPGIGRVQDYWVDPTNTDRIFMVSRSGGFWRTADGGSTWENTTDFLVASGVFTLDVNPQNSQEILIAVQHGGLGYSHGVYRSTNGGTTWSESDFNPIKLSWGGLGDNERIYKLRYHPRVANQVYVGTTRGLYVSNDNLRTWSLAFNGIATDVAFHPTKMK